MRPASPAPPPFSPTLEFRRHHTVEAPAIDARQFRTAWRIRSRLDMLLRDDAISLREYEMALRFRRGIEIAFGDLLRAPDLERAIGAKHQSRRGDPAIRLAGRLDVVEQLRRVERALGAATYHLLVLVLADDVSWCELGRRFSCDPKTARSRTIAAVKRLANLSSSEFRR